MKKSQVSFVCQECGYDSPQWLGKCPECGNWNSMKEVRFVRSVEQSAASKRINEANTTPKKLSDVTMSKTQRQDTGFSEFDTVLGGGLVAGGVILLAGDPGVGKSTLLLQLALKIGRNKVVLSDLPGDSALPGKAGAKDPITSKTNDENKILRQLPQNDNRKVLYISGEESVDQITMRATRLLDKKKNQSAKDNLFLLALTDTERAVTAIEDLKPDLVIVDSIQTMQSANVAGLSGSVPQVRYATLQLVSVAKAMNIPTILVGHVTKEGMVAGPMVLSHMVDVVLFLEGEKFSKTRLLRSLKNRFGPVDEVGVFSMEESGMEEVTDPSQLFLSEQREDVPGSVLVVTMEGSRAFLVELQSLVVYSKLPMPRRVASGIDPRRLELLLAVLQKHCQLPVDTADVFVNVVGGMRIVDPAVDFAICLAVYSSMKNIPLTRVVGIAEVGLLGELRRVANIEKRIREAKQFGFSHVLTAQTHKSLRHALADLQKKRK